MIVCRCRDCKYNVGSSRCGLENITISNNGKCWSKSLSNKKRAEAIVLSDHERLKLLEQKFLELDLKSK